MTFDLIDIILFGGACLVIGTLLGAFIMCLLAGGRENARDFDDEEVTL